MMTHQTLIQQRLKHFRTPSQILNALSAVLDRSFIKIIRFIKELGRGRTPWVHYELANGQRLATFISPKAFQGYWWNKDYSQTINKSTGTKYQVTNSYCSCPDWNNRVRTGKKKQCKHQAMRAEHIGINLSDSLPKNAKVEQVERVQPQRGRSKLYAVNPNILDDGFTLDKIEDSTDTKYYLKAWYKSDSSVAPVLKTLGIITETEQGFVVTGLEEYQDFDWNSIGAKILDRDSDGVSAVSWHGKIYKRRSPENKFAPAIWFSRKQGNDYYKLITFKTIEAAEPLSRKVLAQISST
ncbi:MAG: single-stranded DNA-binding protein [Prochloraceae cyanobacterium]|nr:single-stranded DNA-binding protein [Prochloraceae cyanobacterium]